MKKIVSLILCIVMLAGVASLNATAAETIRELEIYIDCGVKSGDEPGAEYEVAVANPRSGYMYAVYTYKNDSEKRFSTSPVGKTVGEITAQ